MARQEEEDAEMLTDFDDSSETSTDKSVLLTSLKSNLENNSLKRRLLENAGIWKDCVIKLRRLEDYPSIRKQLESVSEDKDEQESKTFIASGNDSCTNERMISVLKDVWNGPCVSMDKVIMKMPIKSSPWLHISQGMKNRVPYLQNYSDMERDSKYEVVYGPTYTREKDALAVLGNVMKKRQTFTPQKKMTYLNKQPKEIIVYPKSGSVVLPSKAHSVNPVKVTTPKSRSTKLSGTSTYACNNITLSQSMSSTAVKSKQTSALQNSAPTLTRQVTEMIVFPKSEIVHPQDKVSSTTDVKVTTKKIKQTTSSNTSMSTQNKSVMAEALSGTDKQNNQPPKSCAPPKSVPPLPKQPIEVVVYPKAGSVIIHKKKPDPFSKWKETTDENEKADLINVGTNSKQLYDYQQDVEFANKSETDMFQCDKCPKRCSKVFYLISHKRLAHNCRFVCFECGASLPNSVAERSHICSTLKLDTTSSSNRSMAVISVNPTKTGVNQYTKSGYLSKQSTISSSASNKKSSGKLASPENVIVAYPDGNHVPLSVAYRPGGKKQTVHMKPDISSSVNISSSVPLKFLCETCLVLFPTSEALDSHKCILSLHLEPMEDDAEVEEVARVYAAKVLAALD